MHLSQVKYPMLLTNLGKSVTSFDTVPSEYWVYRIQNINMDEYGADGGFCWAGWSNEVGVGFAPRDDSGSYLTFFSPTGATRTWCFRMNTPAYQDYVYSATYAISNSQANIQAAFSVKHKMDLDFLHIPQTNYLFHLYTNTAQFARFWEIRVGDPNAGMEYFQGRLAGVAATPWGFGACLNSYYRSPWQIGDQCNNHFWQYTNGLNIMNSAFATADVGPIIFVKPFGKLTGMVTTWGGVQFLDNINTNGSTIRQTRFLTNNSDDYFPTVYPMSFSTNGYQALWALGNSTAKVLETGSATASFNTDGYSEIHAQYMVNGRGPINHMAIGWQTYSSGFHTCVGTAGTGSTRPMDEIIVYVGNHNTILSGYAIRIPGLRTDLVKFAEISGPYFVNWIFLKLTLHDEVLVLKLPNHPSEYSKVTTTTIEPLSFGYHGFTTRIIEYDLPGIQRMENYEWDVNGTVAPSVQSPPLRLKNL